MCNEQQSLFDFLENENENDSIKDKDIKAAEIKNIETLMILKGI